MELYIQYIPQFHHIIRGLMPHYNACANPTEVCYTTGKWYYNFSTVISKSSHLREARRKITATMATMRAATEEQNATITSQVITIVIASRTMRLHVPGMEGINHSHDGASNAILENTFQLE